MDLLKFGLCFVVWVLCISKTNGGSDEELLHEGGKGKTILEKIESPEAATELKQSLNNLTVKETIDNIQQNVMLSREIVETSILPSTDIPRNEFSELSTHQTNISSIYTTEKNIIPTRVDKASNFSSNQNLTEFLIHNAAKTFLIPHPYSDDNDNLIDPKPEPHNEEYKPAEETKIINNNFELNSNGYTKHNRLVNDRETTTSNSLNTSGEHGKLTAQTHVQYPIERCFGRLRVNNFFKRPGPKEWNDDLRKILIEDTNLYISKNSRRNKSNSFRPEAWPVDSTLKKYPSKLEFPSKLELPKPSISSDDRLRGSFKMLSERFPGTAAKRSGINLLEIDQSHDCHKPLSFERFPKNNRDHQSGSQAYGPSLKPKGQKLLRIYNTIYDSIQAPMTSYQHVIDSGFDKTSYQSTPYDASPDKKLYDTKYQKIDGDFVMKYKSGPMINHFKIHSYPNDIKVKLGSKAQYMTLNPDSVKTFHNNKALRSYNWGNDGSNNEYISPSFFTSQKQISEPMNIPYNDENSYENLSIDVHEPLSMLDYDSYYLCSDQDSSKSPQSDIKALLTNMMRNR